MTLDYDPAMRLYQLTGGSTTRFAYDGLDMIAEYDGAGTMLARYVHGPGMDQPLVRYDGSGTGNKQSLHADERGSITALSYGSPYAPTINLYDEYGKPQSGNVGRFQYTGQTWIGELSAYYYKARIYSPTLGGRFLQIDPIGYEGGINLYAYVGNDPVNWIDPLGLDEDVVVRWTGPKNQPRFERAFFGGSLLSDLFGNLFPSWEGENTTQEVVVKGKRPPKKGPHFYKIEIDTACSASEAFSKLRQPGVSAPGAPYAKEGTTTGIRLMGNNPITQVVSSRSMTIRNITERNHEFYPGTVDIRVTPRGAGSRITVVGKGTGARPRLNEVLGEAIFGSAASSVEQDCLGAVK